jgi:hypothetical protein
MAVYERMWAFSSDELSALCKSTFGGIEWWELILKSMSVCHISLNTLWTILVQAKTRLVI